MKGIKSLKAAWTRRTSAVFAYTLDTIAPPDPAVRTIENMSMDEFIASASEAVNERDGIARAARPIEGVLHLFPYRTSSETMRTALVTIKTYHNPRLVRLIAGAIYRTLPQKLPIRSDSLPFVLIPVPMTRKSVRARGWNQCESICKEIARLDAMNSVGAAAIFEYRSDILMKVRETADQVGQNRAGRFENLRNSCEVRADRIAAIRDRDVIVLDDIVTTGSTLSEARRALTDAGAGKIFCIAIAH